MNSKTFANVIFMLVWIQIQSLWTIDTAQGSPLGVLSGVEEIYVLAGQQRPASVICAISLGVSPATIQWQLNGNTIQVDNIKYRLASSTELQINDLVGSDEGVYSCSFQVVNTRYTIDLACIYILGKAEFTTGNSASVISALSGNNVELDTSIQYIGSGSSQRNQAITLLQLFKHDNETGADKLVYFCSNEGSSNMQKSCPSTDRFLVREGSHKFDVSLVVRNASTTDAGEYVARVEVLNPGVSSRSYVRKNFRVSVRDPLVMTATQGAASNSVLEHFIQCQVQLDTISQSDHVRLEWKDTLGNNIESNIGVSLHTAVNAEDIVLTAVLDTSTAKQGTEYFCTATLNLPDTVSPLSQTVGITLELPDDNSTNSEELFQVYIGPVSSSECSVWFDSIQSNNMENTIREGIALAASTQSGSEISSNAFNIGRLSCRGPGDWLSYRSSIKNTATHTKTQLLGFLEGWVGTSKPTIQLGLFYLNVNSLCSVKISSLTEPECSN